MPLKLSPPDDECVLAVLSVALVRSAAPRERTLSRPSWMAETERAISSCVARCDPNAKSNWLSVMLRLCSDSWSRSLTSSSSSSESPSYS